MYATLTIEAIDFEQELIFTPEERYAQLTLYVQQLQLSVESNLSTVVAEFFLGNYLKGVGISSIYKTSSAGLIDTYTITFTDNTTTTFDVTNGKDGADGIGISNIELVSTVGKVKTYRITFTNSSTFEYTITDGADGRGIVSIIKTSTVGLVDTYTITYSDTTTSTFDVTNGTNGEMNVIEEVQVNSVPLPVTNKSVNVIVPTQPSDIGAEPANSNIQEHIADETIHHTIEELNEVYEPANSNIQEHISDTDIHIDSSSELGEAINESTHSLLLWNGLKALKVTFARLKTWIGSYFLKLDQSTPQTIQGLLQNQSTTALESAPLGSELLTSSNWTTTGWTGYFVNGFTHTTGNVTPLTNTLAALNNTLYQITYTITNRTAGSVNITFGGVSTGGVTSSGAIGNRTASTGTLSITPTTDFNGTIVISIKRITGIYAPSYQILDSAGISTLEIRSSLNTLNNTFIGKGAGSYNTTGFNNSAQGNAALYSNTTGYNNSAQGVDALRNNKTGSFNSAQGVFALYSNTTGSYNSAQGYFALYSNTTGSYNSAQGRSALFYNTTGFNNSAQGDYALFSNTTGSYNSAQGRNAGSFLADGVTANQNSNNSLFLGSNTKSKQANQTNEVVIGSDAIGNGSNTVTLGHTTVTDTYLRGRVHTNSSMQIGDDTSVASSANEFAIRGRKGVNGNIGFSVTEMCMQTDVGEWDWVEIVRNEWIIP